jgi:macrolide transport system ATP-binding/permease protein
VLNQFLKLWRRLLFYIRRDRFDRELAEEMQFHLEMKVQANLQAGMTPDQARSAAQRQFGNQTRLQEVSREMWGIQTIETLFQDLRYGVKMLLKHRGFTIVAVLSLALGIGANTAIFSLIDAVLLKLLPVERPQELYFVQNVGPRRPDGGAPPYPCFERFRQQSTSFSGLAAFNQVNLKLRIDDQLEELRGQRVSGNYFSLLGVNAILGRVLSPTDDTVPGQGGADGLVAVISYNYWTQRFAQNPAIIGKVLQLDNKPVTITGVIQPEFYGLVPGKEFDIYLSMTAADSRMLAANRAWWFEVVGRLGPGISTEQARLELDAIFQSYMDELNFSAESRREAFDRIDVRSASQGLNILRRQFSRPLQALMAIVALVLLIACVNVANLLLARATSRHREFAVRLALGASRFRLMRQMFTESLLLVFLSAALGLVLARWGSAFLVSFVATGRGQRGQLFINLPLDYRVLLFTAAVALFTGLLFGLAPALQALRLNPNSALKNSSGTNTGSGSRFGKSLLVAQVALSLLLLIGAGLFVRTLYNLKTMDAGFRTEGVLTMTVALPQAAYQGPRLTNLWKDILARVENLPGVSSASLCVLSPLDGNYRDVTIDVQGFTPDAESDKDIRLNQISTDYCQTLGVALLQGRNFTEADNEVAPRVALINEAAAHFYFGDRNPLGAQFRFSVDLTAGSQLPAYQIIGVVKDLRSRNLREVDTRTLYLPITQARDRLERLTLAVHSDQGKPTELTSAIRNEIRAVDSDILLTDTATLSEQVDRSLVQERLVATLSLFFGVLALLLACIGLYGVMSYDVALRTREIGIRMALGASAGGVVHFVLRSILRWVALGLLLGLGSALVATHWVESLLFGLKPNDPLTIGLALLVLLAVAAIAGYLPARRAARIDPLVSLRHE